MYCILLFSSSLTIYLINSFGTNFARKYLEANQNAIYNINLLDNYNH